MMNLLKEILPKSKKKCKIIASNKLKKDLKVRAENWDKYIEDLIFLKHLHPMAYIDTVKYDSLDF